MIVLGIDPGLTGALAFYDTEEKTVEVHDMPVVSVVRNGKTKNEVSAVLTSNIIAEQCKGMPTTAFLERVNAMPGQGVTSVFSFGRSSGIIEGILAAYDIPTHIGHGAKIKKGRSPHDEKPAQGNQEETNKELIYDGRSRRNICSCCSRKSDRERI